MLSVLLGTATITMNRGEQETLYRQARNLRLHQEIKAQQNNSNLKPRHHSYGNIHQLNTGNRLLQHPPPPQGMNLRSSFAYEEQQRPLNATAYDDLVLSVLKSPLRDQSTLSNLSSVAATSVNSGDSVEGSHRTSTVTTLTTTLENNNESKTYKPMQASEDDLVDDVDLTMETTELNEHHRDSTNLNADLSPYGLKFLRRFRAPKFEAHHHRRVPTPMRRKHNRGRSKSTADILDVGVNATNTNDEEAAMQDDGGAGMEGGKSKLKIIFLNLFLKKIFLPLVDNPYYPIALPIDQAFKAKYMFHHRRGKTFQERLYVFLEHPVGWLCFIYHFTV
jgi:hypothetical protein